MTRYPAKTMTTSPLLKSDTVLPAKTITILAGGNLAAGIIDLITARRRRKFSSFEFLVLMSIRLRKRVL